MLQDAAREKAAAGEGCNVEHVAEANNLTHAPAPKKRKRQSAQMAQQPGVTKPTAVDAPKRSRKKRS